MSGASVPYHLRQNKYVERRLFVDLLEHINRWRALKHYLYVGFGAIYFEDFKLLHSQFGMKKMLSIEREEWVIPRQDFNRPYGCVDHKHCDSSSFIQDLDAYRREYKPTNLLIWLDYAGGKEIAAQLNDVKALIPKLLANDVLKVTFEADPDKLVPDLDEGDTELLVRRYEQIRTLLGTQFMPDGMGPAQMTAEGFPVILCEAFKRVVASGMKESPDFLFQPIGSYVYRDTLQMVTIMGIVLRRGEIEEFLKTTDLKNFDLAGPTWQVLRIEVPDLSLREKLNLDRAIPGKSIADVQKEFSVPLAEDADETRRMIENYMKFYRYYPNFHPVVV